jgi:hypothetical protein
VAGALAQLESWLLEPLPDQAVASVTAELPPRPIVAVVGLAPGCGTTTVARALAARLAARDPGRAAVLAGSPAPTALVPATRSASRLRIRLRARHGVRAVGRLCVFGADVPELIAVVDRQSPVVLDGAPPGAISADVTVVVAPPDAEPALAELFARSLPGPGEPLIAVSRARESERWTGRASLFLPESQVGARLAAAGWEPRGALGRSVAELAATCEAAACA